MLNPQQHLDTAWLQKSGKTALKPPAEAAREAQAKSGAVQTAGAVQWFRVENKDGGFKLEPAANTNDVDVTTVSVRPDEVEAPKEFSFLGHKINLRAKLDGLKENYVKNFALTKSHNLMVARFAELKASTLAYLLSFFGCTVEDVRQLQKKAVTTSIKQNKVLFEENEYNGELLAIVGGGGKRQVRAQNKVIGEVRNQLVAQARNLGLTDYYTQDRIVEIKIEACRKILSKFNDEKNNLQYQLAMSGAS